MPHRASPKQATPIPPRLKRAGLSGPFSVIVGKGQFPIGVNLSQEVPEQEKREAEAEPHVVE